MTCAEKDIQGLIDELSHVCSESPLCLTCKHHALTKALAALLIKELDQDDLQEALSSLGIVAMQISIDLHKELLRRETDKGAAA